MAVTENTALKFITTILFFVSGFGFISGVTSRNICSTSYLTVGTDKEYITSPNYPRSYSSNHYCGLRINIGQNAACHNAIQVKVVSFNTESCCDWLKVYDGTSTSSQMLRSLAGRQYSSTYVRSTGNTMYLQFRSDGSVHSTGFNVSVQAVMSDSGSGGGASTGSTGGNNTMCQVTSLGVSSTTGYIVSPGYPLSSYRSNLDCHMTICSSSATVLRLKMITMNLGEKGDKLIFSKGTRWSPETIATFTGNEVPQPLFLIGGRYNISLHSGIHSQAESEGLGFNMSVLQYQPPVRFTDVCGPEQVNLLATEEEHFIASHRFPSNYQNSLRCAWLVSTDDERHSILQIAVHNMSLEKTFDFLRIYDGDSVNAKLLASYTGNVHPYPIFSSGPDVFIVFSTDRKNTQDGFRISYKKQLTIPSFSDVVNVTTSQDSARITVQFSSLQPYTSITWLKNGAVIDTDGDQYSVVTEERKLDEFENYVCTLTIQGLAANDYGEYKISVRNDRGFAEMLVMLHKPEAVPNIIDSSTDVQLSNATITVNFRANPLYENVSWRKLPNNLNYSHGARPIELIGERYITSVRETRDPNGSVMFTATLYIINLVETDLTTYRVYITNSAGTATFGVTLGYPDEAIPVIDENIQATIGRRDAYITVTFSSLIGRTIVEFRKDGVLLEENVKYGLSSGTYDVPSTTTMPPTTVYSVSDTVVDSVHSILFNSTVLYSNFSDTQNVSVSSASVRPVQRSLPTFRERHVLTIKSLQDSDFGTYKITVKNAAGTAERYTELKRAPVFPLERTCQQAENLQLTCRIESCNQHRLFWIHSVGNQQIRSLDGSQDDNSNTNTLTINNCEYTDGGGYSCVIAQNEDDDIINDLPLNDNVAQFEEIMGGMVTVVVNAVPVISGSRTDSKMGKTAITIEFSSNPRYSSIRWFKGGSEINTRNSSKYESMTVPSNVTQTIHGKSAFVNGYNSTLVINNPGEHDFERYKVKVENKVGHSTFFVTLRNPSEGPADIISNLRHIKDANDTDIFSVMFRSFPSPNTIVWSRDGLDLSDVDRFSILLTTQPAYRQNEHIYISSVRIQDIQKDDFRPYKLTITNDVGYTERYFVFMDPEDGVPTIVDDVRITITNNTAMVEVTFSSEPLYRSVHWYKGILPLSQDDKYTLAEEESQKAGDHIATLVITPFQDEDMGEYRIAIRNELGVTEKRISVVRGCPA